jgi:hypothetical protein
VDELRVFQAITPGGDTWMSAGLGGTDPQSTFGNLVMARLSKCDDPPLHLDLTEVLDTSDHHFASVRFDFPGVWEIVEPNVPIRRLPGTRIDPGSYALGDPKAMSYGRS